MSALLHTADVGVRNLPPAVLEVAHKVHDQLDKLGVPHCLVGGIAVGAYASNRTTEDVDVLIRRDDVDKLPKGKALGLVEGFTITVDNLPVDFIVATKAYLKTAIMSPVKIDGLPFLPPEALIVMKIQAGRAKDLADVVELVKAGKLDIAKTRKYIEKSCRDCVEDFDAYSQIAALEAKGKPTKAMFVAKVLHSAFLRNGQLAGSRRRM
jgi:hypothetical protein